MTRILPWFCTDIMRSRGHLRTHNEKHDWPFPCEKCEARFLYPKDRTRHMVKHGNESGRAEPKYLCPERSCEYYEQGFPRKDNFKRHLLLHNPHLKGKQKDPELNMLVANCTTASQRQQRASSQTQSPLDCTGNPSYDVQQELLCSYPISVAPPQTQSLRPPLAPLNLLPDILRTRSARPPNLEQSTHSSRSLARRPRRGSSN